MNVERGIREGCEAAAAARYNDKKRAAQRSAPPAAAEMLWQVGASDEAGFELEIKPTFFYRAVHLRILCDS